MSTKKALEFNAKTQKALQALLGTPPGAAGAAGIVAVTESAVVPTNFTLSPGRQILEDAGIDYDAEAKALQREPERQALEDLATPRKRKIRKPRS